MSIKKHGVSRGAVKKGLSPASLLHFRFEEKSGVAFTDDVAGVVIDYSGQPLTTFDFTAPYAIENTVAGSKQLMTNLSTKIQSMTHLDSGYLVAYGTASYHSHGNNGVGCLDVTGSTVTPAGSFVMECNAEGAEPLLVGTDYYAGEDIGNGIDFVRVESGQLLVADIAAVDTYTYVCKIQWGKSPAFRYADSLGNIFSLTSRTNGSAEPYILDYWDLTEALTAIFVDVPAYTIGLLYFSEEPSDEDMLACATWHTANAPKGNKDVWQGWNKYNAG